MGSEIFLYGYGIVCISMLIYNILYNFYSRSSNQRLEKHAEKLSKRVQVQLQNGVREGVVALSHQRYMRRKLSKITQLLAFEHFLEEEADPEENGVYLQEMRGVFQQLADIYRRRESTQAAYFCYFISHHAKALEAEELREKIVSYMEKDSLYCRVHALKALCAFGDPESVVDALLLMERKQGAELHEKVIVEILLIFQGEADLLIECLWKDIKQFSVRIQRALLDYIRFQSGKYGDEMLAIMENEALDKELRFAAIRYFGKYPDPRAKDTLLSFTRDLDSLKWEFTAISASSLARYEGTDVIEALIAAMHSANWYVRYNAAASLEAQGLSYGQLLEVLQGDDRYARDMLAYRLEVRKMMQERRSAG